MRQKVKSKNLKYNFLRLDKEKYAFVKLGFSWIAFLSDTSASFNFPRSCKIPPRLEYPFALFGLSLIPFLVDISASFSFPRFFNITP